MSGVATLGVLASVTQLAAYSIKIALHLEETYAAFRNASAPFTGHIEQIKELIGITLLIEQQKDLWSPAVHRQLQATLSEAQILYELLRDLASKYSQNSIWKYWSILSRVTENQILSSLESLERQKSTLRLCIDTVHTDLLLSIKGSIATFTSAEMPKMKKRSTEPSQTSALDPNANQPIMQQQSHSAPSRAGATNFSPQESGGQSALVPHGSTETSQSSDNSRSQTASGFPSMQEYQKHTTVQGSSTSTSNATAGGHSYRDITVHSTALQHAGDQNGTSAQAATIAAAKSHTFQNVTAEPHSMQIIGNMNGKEGIDGFYAQKKLS